MTESPSTLGSLAVFWDQAERSAAHQLALDEALLNAAEIPLLRFYRWHGAALTLGYFQRWREVPAVTEAATATVVKASHPDRGASSVDMARRWTGGGMVDHRGDCPYSLMVPAGHPLAKLPAMDSYRWIHQRLAQSITETTDLSVVADGSCATTTSASGEPALACFDAPVAWDVVEEHSGRQKVAGAAQRRSRGRLLHQGSVLIREGDGGDGTADESLWRQAFAEALAPGRTATWRPNDCILEDAARLASERYATVGWLQRF